MSMPSSLRGWSLLEMLLVLAVLGILLAVALPSLSAWVERQRLLAATELVYRQLQWLRMEALKQGRPMYSRFVVDSGGQWHLGLSDVAGCDPSGQDASKVCRIVSPEGTAASVTVFHGRDYPGIRLLASGFSGGEARFEPLRGVADNGRVTLLSPGGLETRVLVSVLGRIRVCSPAGAARLAAYSDQGC
ncbi:GspH/FimT family pseudopilin [Craterilacuibacter sp.]|uniref:GspH/FimT family pseudopilin n=1 Tax=Craterilacuibacter sp. TaxID=2870909 RepID=UPI003F35BEFF